jgi:hypothetical protein
MLLASCGQGPSESDIKASVGEKSEFFGVKITNLDKHKCTKMPDGRYRCSYTVTAKSPGGTAKSDASAIFEEMGDHWALVGS